MTKKYFLSLLGLAAFVGNANAQQFDYYEFPDPLDSVVVTTQENDLWPVSNLIQGPGEGFEAEAPNNQLGGGDTHLWVTAADAGFPSDYIEDVGIPVVQLDLGADRTLKEISVWGYSATNSNGTSQFSLRFATEAEGGTDGLLADPIEYGQSITYNPTFNMFLDPGPQQYKLFSEVVTARYVEFTNLDNFYNPPGDGSEPPEPPPERLLPVRPGGDRVGLGEIAFMILPDSFQPGDLLPRKIEGDAFGMFEVSASQTGQTFGPPSEPEPGLLQEWFAVSNPGSRENAVSAFAANTPVVPAFRAESGITWWSGSDTVDDVPNYPTEVDGLITGDNYSTRLTGEILIEESGPIRFLDGVDDFTYLAIDIDRSGIAGDSAEEVLINDNNWTNALSNANGGAPIVEVDFEGIGSDGEWLAIEFNTGEAGGGDSGMLYWDAMDEDDFFPFEQGEGVLEIDAAVFMIPESNLRSSVRELISADAEGSLAAAIGQADVIELELQVGPEGSDQIVLQDLTAGEGVATLDVSGSTVRVIAADGIAEGTEFQIFGADAVTGLDTFNLIAEGFNTSRLGEGIITFGAAGPICDPNSQGDLDGDGSVGFPDFLILSANFGGEGGGVHTTGDIDCDGAVGFPDFLVLSANFGTEVGAQAASVPEPSGLMLTGIACLIGGVLRRRRR